MKKCLLAIISVSAGMALMSSCTKNEKTDSGLFAAKSEAEIACKKWQESGGTWKLQVNDFRISKQDQKHASEFPLEVGSNSRNKDDLTIHDFKQSEDFKAYLPLFSSGEKKSQLKGKIILDSSDKKNLITYNKRVCELEKKDVNTIYGKEYSIKSGVTTLETNIPALTIKKRFIFN